MKSKTLFLFTFLLTFHLSCSQELSDDQLRKIRLGTWQQVEKQEDRLLKLTTTYRSDGTSTLISENEIYEIGKYRRKSECTWKIEDGNFYEQTVSANLESISGSSEFVKFYKNYFEKLKCHGMVCQIKVSNNNKTITLFKPPTEKHEGYEYVSNKVTPEEVANPK
jgi:hypothetical protein